MMKSLIVLYIQFSFHNNILSHLVFRNGHGSASPSLSGTSPRCQLFAFLQHHLGNPVPGIKLQRVAIDAQSGWPPRASIVQSQVLTTNSSSSFFVAQIPISVNGVAMLALVDTGAAITVTSSSLSSLLGVFRLQHSSVTSAVGMAGIQVPLVGCAPLTLQVGHITLEHLVYFTKGPCVPRHVDKYNILGNDFLSRVPSWHISYSKRLFTVGDNSVQILSTAVPSSAVVTSPEEVIVSVAATTVIPAATETLVRCFLDQPLPGHMMLVSQSTHVLAKNLTVSPAVFQAPTIFLLVTNPSSKAEVLYTKQRLGTAVPLVQDETGMLALRQLVSPKGSFIVDPAITNRDFIDQAAPLNIDLSQCDVIEQQKSLLLQLFTEFRDRISHSNYDLGSYHHTLVDVKTTTDILPTKFRPPRIPIKFQKELYEHINKLLKSGRIAESDTPWVHNTVLVKKRDGSLRVCLDFRPLNTITIPDHYPLPRIEDLLSKVAGHRYYTTLELASGYMQLLMTPQSQEKCGWATHRGIYQFVYLPFGLRNAGAYFCRAMSRILAEIDENCLACIDDIIVFNKDFDSHLQSIRKVFNRFRTFNIKTSGKKLTEIARPQITFLGHEISRDSYSPARRNIQFRTSPRRQPSKK